VITPLGRDEELLRREVGGVGSQNYEVPPSLWRIRDRVTSMVGRRPRFSQHSPAYVVRRYVAPEVWREYYKFTFERNPWDLVVSAYHWYHREGRRPHRSFSEFVFSETLSNYSNWRLYTIHGVVVVDRVYMYDQFQDAVDDLSRRLGLASLDLPRVKAGLRPADHPYWEMYGNDERQRVTEIFRNEIAEFGWQFGR
jgi:hypothetical protein